MKLKLIKVEKQRTPRRQHCYLTLHVFFPHHFIHIHLSPQMIMCIMIRSWDGGQARDVTWM